MHPRGPAVAVVVGAVAATSAFAVDYMSAEDAARLMFPAAERFELRELQLDAATLKRLDEMGVRARSARWTVRVAQRGGRALGYVVVDDVIGKFELITYAVGISAEGTVQQVEVLSYRESHGHEIRLPAWRRQFVGKTSAAPLRLGDDISNISGATLSCRHLTEGVRRIVMLIEQARRAGPLS
jgi:Na+-translocating ferredoxin:NAD+ oxidoreductase RnfG subunit